MLRPLRVLILEDTHSDAELVVRELRRAGFAPEWERVETEETFLDSLQRDFDIILSDYTMPQFDGMRALELAKRRGLETPFILVSGTIGEETAVAAMKLGATDYLLKDRLARLGPAVAQALEQAALRKERVQRAAELRFAHEQLSQMLEHSPAVIYALKVEGEDLVPYMVSENIIELLGFNVQETLHYEWWVGQLHVDDRARALASISETLTQGRSLAEYRLRHKDGSYRWVEDKRRLIRDSSNQQKEIVGVWADISERKRADEVLHSLSLQESVRRKTTIRRDLWGVLGLTGLTFAAAYRFNLFERALKMVFDEKRFPLADETFGAVLFLALALVLFSYRRWKESAGEVDSQKHAAGALHVLHDELNQRVQQRTAELAKANETLRTQIAERARVGEALRESERRFREMLENVELVAMTLDKDGRVTFCNDYLLRVTGREREKVIGADWFSTFIPDTNPAVRKAFFEAIEAGEIPSRYENPIKTRSGELREITWSNTMLRDIAGNIVGTASLGEDVTERKRAEAAARVGEAQIRDQANLLNLAQDAIMVRGMDDRIEFWNRGAELLYGWSAEEVYGQPSGQFLDYEKPVKILADRILLETGAWSGECRHLTKKGDTVIVCSRWTLVRGEDGQPKSKLIITTDVTEQRKLEMHLLRAQRLESIGTLASGVAHDLNNILTPIMICADTLRGNMTAEEREATLALIKESAKRGAGVVKQVLAFARGVEGERVSINPTHLLHEIVDIGRTTFPKSIDITNRNPDGLWMIKGDPTQLHQVLLNISVNARDAMPAGGKLALVSENFVADEEYAAKTPGAMPGSYVLLQISDTGGGMSQETIDKIFDPFFTTKEVGYGTGLGLSTTVGIVKSHGGFISVHSEVGKGTIFKVFLPADLSGRSSLSSEQRLAPTEGNGELVLVIDDEPNVLRVTKTILERHNYRVITASDGMEAVPLFRRHMETIRVVLTDVAMPRMDGVATARAIREMKPDIPISVFTGDAQRARTDEFRTLNVNSFLIKPFNAATLLAAVHASVGACGGVETDIKTITHTVQSGANPIRTSNSSEPARSSLVGVSSGRST